MRCAWLVVWLVGCGVARERPPPAPTPDAATSQQPDAAPPSCESVREAFQAYVAAHDTCETADDCTAIGGRYSCACGPSLGSASGDGIRVDAVAGAAPFLTAFASCVEETYSACSAAPGIVSCRGGHCRVSEEFCVGPPAADDLTTGSPCTTDAECDTTGAHLARCSNHRTAFADDPSPVCFRHGDFTQGVCDPRAADPRCDGGRGVCVRIASSLVACDPACEFGEAGFVQSCVGKDTCQPLRLVTAKDGTAHVIGRCAGGCDTDADCPAGACDATTRRCTRACNRSGSCFSSSSTSTTSAWLCDVARGGCTFYTTKKMGDPCNWPGACFCTSGALDVVGMCSRACRPGEDCGASFVCDALVPPEVALLEQPRELLGMCRRICTADADCGGEVCGASGGLKVKTCRPKW